MTNDLPHPRVLVVEDESLIRWSIAETLHDSGCAVLEADDADGALKALKDSAAPIDVVVLDYCLPDPDSLALLATIRRLAPSTEVIMVTAFGAPELTSGALALGAFRVMNKPFEMGDIAKAVQQAYDGHPH
jgi:two-component system, NtrC family, response regulator AtoC